MWPFSFSCYAFQSCRFQFQFSLIHINSLTPVRTIKLISVRCRATGGRVTEKIDEFERFYGFCYSMGIRLNETDMQKLSKLKNTNTYIASQAKLLSLVRSQFIKADVLNHGVRIAAIKNKTSYVNVYRILAQEKKNAV